jgi:hypothetical protein
MIFIDSEARCRREGTHLKWPKARLALGAAQPKSAILAEPFSIRSTLSVLRSQCMWPAPWMCLVPSHIWCTMDSACILSIGSSTLHVCVQASGRGAHGQSQQNISRCVTSNCSPALQGLQRCPDARPVLLHNSVIERTLPRTKGYGRGEVRTRSRLPGCPLQAP